MLRDDEITDGSGPGMATLFSDEQLQWFDWGCRCQVDDLAMLDHAILLAVNNCLQREGRDTALLDQTPLYDCIDPEALTTLLSARGHTTVEASFTYEGYHVTVSSDGEMTVRDEVPASC